MEYFNAASLFQITFHITNVRTDADNVGSFILTEIKATKHQNDLKINFEIKYSKTKFLFVSVGLMN